MTTQIPAGVSSVTIAIIISMLASAFAMMMYGVMWSVLNEIDIPISYAATAIGIASMVIYLPDLFVPAMFGNWLDTLEMRPATLECSSSWVSVVWQQWYYPLPWQSK